MKTYLVKAGHSWDTIEACYSEIVEVHKGYAVVKLYDTLGVMRMRGYDIVQELRDGESFDFDTLTVLKGQPVKLQVEVELEEPAKPHGGRKHE